MLYIYTQSYHSDNSVFRACVASPAAQEACKRLRNNTCTRIQFAIPSRYIARVHSFAYFVIINYFCVIYGNVQPWWIDCSNVALNLFVRDTGAQPHRRNVAAHLFFFVLLSVHKCWFTNSNTLIYMYLCIAVCTHVWVWWVKKRQVHSGPKKKSRKDAYRRVKCTEDVEKV